MVPAFFAGVACSVLLSSCAQPAFADLIAPPVVVDAGPVDPGPYFELGVIAGPRYFRASSLCPDGVTIHAGVVQTPGAGDVIGVGSSCTILVIKSALADLSPAEQVSAGRHEDGHAEFGLTHDDGPTAVDPTGVMGAALNPSRVDRLLAADYMASSTEPSARVAVHQAAVRAADHRCKAAPARCRRVSPKLAARVLGGHR